MKLNATEIQWSGLSAGDEIGRVFLWKDGVYRAIHMKQSAHVHKLITCGLLTELEQAKLIPGTKVTDLTLDGYALVLEHTKIHTLTYPYEWSFQMLKDAALTVLRINIIAKKFGYQTKDCHAFNVVFDGTNPCYVDIGSFVEVAPDYKGWLCYDEFLRSYEYLLQIAGTNEFHWVRQLLTADSLITHESFLLYKYPILRLFGIDFLKRVMNVYLRYRVTHRFDSEKRAGWKRNAARFLNFMREKNLDPLQGVNLLRLERRIRKVKKLKYSTTWGNYHDEFQNNATGEIADFRFRRIIEILKGYEIRSVFEVAGNQGFFSKLMVEHLKPDYVTCSDYDENAVDVMYTLNKGDKSISPVLMNFLFPNLTSFTANPKERFHADVVVALAVTHHILITQRLNIDFVLSSLGNFTRKYVAVEFMPLGLWDGKVGQPIPEWYNIEWFRTHFKQRFNLLLEEQLEPNRIMFFGELKS